MKEMRRQDRKIEKGEAAEILKGGEYGVLSTVNQQGEPYGVPVSYVFLDNDIYFHGAGEGYKIDNIKNNANVSFCVVGKTQLLPEKFSTRYESVIAFGTASEANNIEKLEALKEFINKYSKDFISKGREYIQSDINKVTVIKISVGKITGKARR